MLELPRKRIAFLGGGLILSRASNARMSFSKELVLLAVRVSAEVAAFRE
jgi:hypothetical protein